jgi:prepilin-type N-terminal cleavage/methylation domain-containing protein
MMIRMLKRFHYRQGGFTLIELMASLVITSLIALGAAVSSAQIMNETNRNNHFNTASRNAMNAVHWISRDALEAQVISGSAGFPQLSNLSLSWVDWDNSSHNATYSLDHGKLMRTYMIDGVASQQLIAEYINPADDLTFCSSTNGTLDLTITSSVGEGSKAVSVTEEREMTARPRL